MRMDHLLEARVIPFPDHGKCIAGCGRSAEEGPEHHAEGDIGRVDKSADIPIRLRIQRDVAAHEGAVHVRSRLHVGQMSNLTIGGTPDTVYQHMAIKKTDVYSAG